MSDERPSDVLGALPRRRPHRRSDKRATPAPAAEHAAVVPAPVAERSGTGTKRAPSSRPRGARPANGPRPATSDAQPRRRAEPLRQPAQPAGTPPAPPQRGSRDYSTGKDILGIAAQAAAELAEIGLSVSARALRNAVGRLPRP
ncbi:MAG TPA: hypothetical protein VMB27_08075 [Solirubrobacteraceae bacterium]|nr:hypothetical protein [Solirubrobacteraceae bacterium]